MKSARRLRKDQVNKEAIHHLLSGERDLYLESDDEENPVTSLMHVLRCLPAYDGTEAKHELWLTSFCNKIPGQMVIFKDKLDHLNERIAQSLATDALAKKLPFNYQASIQNEPLVPAVQQVTDYSQIWPVIPQNSPWEQFQHEVFQEVQKHKNADGNSKDNKQSA